MVDASAVGTFLIPDEAGDFSRFAQNACLTGELHAPAHWPVEMASLIRKARRDDRLTDDQAGAAAGVADAIGANIKIAMPATVAHVLDESFAQNLTAYDAAYVLLARSLGAALLTEDRALRRAARALGLDILQP